MKKTNGLSLGVVAVLIVFTIIALMDYFFPGLDPDTRLRNVKMLIVMSAIIFIVVVAKFFPDSEETKESPFFIDLLKLGIAIFVYNLVESSFGGITAHPFFTEEGTFDGRAPLGFLLYIFLLYVTEIILTRGYFWLKNRREQKIKDRRNLRS